MGDRRPMVVDTHVLIWFATGSPRLSDGVRQKLESDPQDVFVSTISLWEMAMSHERGRLGLEFDDARVGILEMVRGPGFNLVPITAEIALSSRTLEFLHEDPGDRFIAATAFELKLPLATVDRRLHKLPWLKTIQ